MKDEEKKAPEQKTLSNPLTVSISQYWRLEVGLFFFWNCFKIKQNYWFRLNPSNEASTIYGLVKKKTTSDWWAMTN